MGSMGRGQFFLCGDVGVSGPVKRIGGEGGEGSFFEAQFEILLVNCLGPVTRENQLGREVGQKM